MGSPNEMHAMDTAGTVGRRGDRTRSRLGILALIVLLPPAMQGCGGEANTAESAQVAAEPSFRRVINVEVLPVEPRGFESVGATRGARPLKRAIQRLLEDALARKLLAGEFLPGETIFVGRSGSELTFTKSAGGDGAQKAASSLN